MTTVLPLHHSMVIRYVASYSERSLQSWFKLDDSSGQSIRTRHRLRKISSTSNEQIYIYGTRHTADQQWFKSYSSEHGIREVVPNTLSVDLYHTCTSVDPTDSSAGLPLPSSVVIVLQRARLSFRRFYELLLLVVDVVFGVVEASRVDCRREYRFLLGVGLQLLRV